MDVARFEFGCGGEDETFLEGGVETDDYGCGWGEGAGWHWEEGGDEEEEEHGRCMMRVVCEVG